VLPPFSGTSASIALATSTSSASVTIAQGSAKQIRIFNDSASVLYWKVGKAPLTVVGTDTFMGPGATEVFSIPPGSDTFAAAVVAGTGTAYAQCGDGV